MGVCGRLCNLPAAGAKGLGSWAILPAACGLLIVESPCEWERLGKVMEPKEHVWQVEHSTVYCRSRAFPLPVVTECTCSQGY